MATRVCLEVGARRCFASALDWPGWCRSGKGEDEALATLAGYSARYASVAAGARIPLARDAATFEVVERVEGNATTDFGAPAIVAASERQPVDATEARRLATLVQACWATLRRAADAAPAELRKGPRGGGRDRDAIVDHVYDAEAAYFRKLGLRLPKSTPAERRTALAARLTEPWDEASAPEGTWPLRYAVRRVGWHALDHAWEIEDRS